MTRRVLAAEVIYLLQKSCGRAVIACCSGRQAHSSSQLSSERRLHASVPYCYAAKRLIVRFVRRNTSDSEALSGMIEARTSRHGRVKGQKSYWGRFHGDVTV